MKIKSLLASATVAVALAAAGSANAAYTFVGSWFVDDGPFWDLPTTQVYSGQEAAAFLYGGNASDYAISTIDNTVANINFMAFYDGWGDEDSCGYDGPCSQSLHIDVGGDGYAQPDGIGNSYSAYVSDHGVHLENFAFRIDGAGAVPEPASWALMISGFGLAGAALRSRRRTATAA